VTDRRAFIGRVTAGFLGALVPVPAPAAEVVALEPFFQHDSYRELRLSPSGKYVGALVPAGGRVRLAVIDLETRSIVIAAALDGDDVDWFEWVNDDRLLFAAVDLQSGLAMEATSGSSHRRFRRRSIGGSVSFVSRNCFRYRAMAATTSW
jgi:hypothetical protein